MTFTLETIRRIETRTYAVVLSDGHSHLDFTCQVVERDGITTVQANPDVLMTADVAARKVAAAVVAFDQAARQQD